MGAWGGMVLMALELWPRAESACSENNCVAAGFAAAVQVAASACNSAK